MMPSAPSRMRRTASAQLADTGKTRIPAAFHIPMYRPGLPAPVVTTGIFSRATISAICSVSGFISIRLTPKGLSVMDLQIRMFSSSRAASMPPVPISPSPPALEQAAAKDPTAILAIPP